MYNVEALEKAILIIDAVKGELALGTKYYSGDRLLTTPLGIVTAMKEGNLIIEPTPERQHLFRAMK